MNRVALPDFLKHIRVVLCRPAHPGNVGSAARAMKTMGLTRLILVAPKFIVTPMTPTPPIFCPGEPFRLPEESFVLASGARDVLENAEIVPTLDEALRDTVLSCALTARRREISAPAQTPREAAPEIIERAGRGHPVALVFGNETFGLSIEEAMRCNRTVTIPGNPDYFSLNLSQAVQVTAYELFSRADLAPADESEKQRLPAPWEEIMGLVGHFAEVMENSGFFVRRRRDRLLRHLTLLFERAAPDRREIDILRGFLKTAQRRMNTPDKHKN